MGKTEHLTHDLTKQKKHSADRGRGRSLPISPSLHDTAPTSSGLAGLITRACMAMTRRNCPEKTIDHFLCSIRQVRNPRLVRSICEQVLSMYGPAFIQGQELPEIIADHKKRPRTCAICGQAFQGPIYKKYCNNACKGIARRRPKISRGYSGPTRPCLKCGESIPVNAWRLCRNCRAENEKLHDSQY